MTDYVRPLRFHFLTRFYDPLVRFTTREVVFKRALLEQLEIKPGQEVLDLGCGTGTLTVEIARAFPGAMVTGIDANPAALAIARSKAAREVLAVRFIRGFAQYLPIDDGRFDVLVSSLFFRHLLSADKESALAEAKRVLKAGGQLHIADWGRPDNVLMRMSFLLVRMLDGFGTTADSVSDRLLELIRAAGFACATKTAVINTPLGSMAIYRAIKDAAADHGHSTPAAV